MTTPDDIQYYDTDAAIFHQYWVWSPSRQQGYWTDPKPSMVVSHESLFTLDEMLESGWYQLDTRLMMREGL